MVLAAYAPCQASYKSSFTAAQVAHQLYDFTAPTPAAQLLGDALGIGGSCR